MEILQIDNLWHRFVSLLRVCIYADLTARIDLMTVAVPLLHGRLFIAFLWFKTFSDIGSCLAEV